MGLIKTRIKIPTTGFIPGQSIDTMVNLNNPSSINVTKICIKLERVDLIVVIVTIHGYSYIICLYNLAYQIISFLPIQLHFFYNFLLQSLEFHAKTPYDSTKKDKTVIKADKCIGSFDQHADAESFRIKSGYEKMFRKNITDFLFYAYI